MRLPVKPSLIVAFIALVLVISISADVDEAVCKMSWPRLTQVRARDASALLALSPSQDTQDHVTLFIWAAKYFSLTNQAPPHVCLRRLLATEQEVHCLYAAGYWAGLQAEKGAIREAEANEISDLSWEYYSLLFYLTKTGKISLRAWGEERWWATNHPDLAEIFDDFDAELTTIFGPKYDRALQKVAKREREKERKALGVP